MTTGKLHQLASDIWWLALLRGIAAVLLGFFLLTNKAATVEVVLILLGIYWLVDGIITLLASFTGRKEMEGWGWGVFAGLISILAGMAILSQPLVTAAFSAKIIVSMIGIMIIISGLSSIVSGFRLRKTSGETMMIGGGALSLILGLLLLFNPLFSAVVYINVLAVFSIIGGILLIVLSFRIKKLANAR